GHHFGAEADGRMVPVEVHGPDNGVVKVLAGICNKQAQGGGLGRQIDEVMARAGENRVALLRSTAFANPRPGTALARQVGALVTKGGRLVPIEDAEWRTMLALQRFHKQHAGRPDYPVWRTEERPLSQLNGLRKLLALDELARARP